MTYENKKMYNTSFEELIGLMVQVVSIILLSKFLHLLNDLVSLEFGNEPSRIGLKDIAALMK